MFPPAQKKPGSHVLKVGAHAMPRNCALPGGPNMGAALVKVEAPFQSNAYTPSTWLTSTCGELHGASALPSLSSTLWQFLLLPLRGVL